MDKVCVIVFTLFLFFTNTKCAIWGVRTPRLTRPTTTKAATATEATTRLKLDTELTLPLHLAAPQIKPYASVSPQTDQSCSALVNQVSPLTPPSRLPELQNRVSMMKPKVCPAEKSPARCRIAFPENPILPAGPVEETVGLPSQRRKRQIHVDGCCQQECSFGRLEVAERDVYGFTNVQIYNGDDEQQYFHQCTCRPTPMDLRTGSCRCVQEYRAQFALVQRSPNGPPVKSWIYVPSCCRSEITL